MGRAVLHTLVGTGPVEPFTRRRLDDGPSYAVLVPPIHYQPACLVCDGAKYQAAAHQLLVSGTYHFRRQNLVPEHLPLRVSTPERPFYHPVYDAVYTLVLVPLDLEVLLFVQDVQDEVIRLRRT